MSAKAGGERGTLSWRTADVRRGRARGLLRVGEKGLVCSGGVQGHVRGFVAADWARVRWPD